MIRQVIPVSFTSPKAGVYLFISRLFLVLIFTYLHTIEWKSNYSIMYYISNILNNEYQKLAIG